MKRYFLFSLLVASILVLAMGSVFGLITGRATTQSTSISVNVVAGAPALTLQSPRNVTYLNSTILLNWSASGYLFAWFNIDGGTNTTLSQNEVLFAPAEGAHSLYFFVNNSDGTIVTRNISFYVNTTLVTIQRTEFAGNSTNFYYLGLEQLHNATGVVLENPAYGRITFGEAINVTNDLNPDDSLVDIDDNVNISFNRIELNSTALPNFNSSATLTLSGLSFVSPRILRDGVACPTSICTQLSYSGGVLMFNVSRFSTYSVEEASTSSGGSSGGGGGGSSRVTSTTNPIVLESTEVKVSMHPGQTLRKTLTIHNAGSQKTLFSIETTLPEFVKISEGSFFIEAGGSKTINLDMLVPQKTTPDLYLGEFVVRSGEAQQRIIFAVDVESEQPLFDTELELSDDSYKIYQGGRISSTIRIFEFGKLGRIDVDMDYQIRDISNKVVFSKSETIAVETRTEIVRTFALPVDVAPGEYVLYVKATYGPEKSVAGASQTFSVIERPASYKLYALIIAIALIIISLFIFISVMRSRARFPELARAKNKKPHYSKTKD